MTQPSPDAVKLARALIALRDATRRCDRCTLDDACDADQHGVQYRALIAQAERILRAAAKAPN